MPPVKYLNLITILHTQSLTYYITQSIFTLFDYLHYFDLAVLFYGGWLMVTCFFQEIFFGKLWPIKCLEIQMKW